MSSGQKVFVESANTKRIEEIWSELCNIIKDHFDEIVFYNAKIIMLRTFKGKSIVEINGDYKIESVLNILTSRIDNDIYGFEGSNPVDGFSYWHYKDKKMIRRLDFGLYGKGEREWNLVLGEAEYWEEDFFFGEGRRQAELFSLKEREGDLTTEPLPNWIKDNLEEIKNGIEEDRKMIEKVFTEKQLIVNTSIPFVGNCANDIEAKMNFECRDNTSDDKELEFRKLTKFNRLINLFKSRKNQKAIEWVQ